MLYKKRVKITIKLHIITQFRNIANIIQLRTKPKWMLRNPTPSPNAMF